MPYPAEVDMATEGTMRPRCSAEVGRPGLWHNCHRAAVLAVFRYCGARLGGYTLYYCRDHAKRVDEHPGMVIRQTVTELA